MSLVERLPISDPLLCQSDSEDSKTDFCIFYENKLKFLCQFPCMKEITRVLKYIRMYLQSHHEVHKLPTFEEKHVRYAYVFTYCILHSVVMHDQFADMLKFNSNIVKRITLMTDLRFCILGGGPAFEAVGVCKLLSRVLVQAGVNRHWPLKVHVTVIDICADWEIEAKCIVGSIQDELCTEGNIEVDFNFIRANLTRKLSPNVKTAIKSAHFVTMFKFVSEVSERFEKENVFKMINNIIESMSYESCLFFLNNSGGGVFRTVDEMIDVLPCSARIYGPCLHICYKLTPDIVEKFSFAVDVFRMLNCSSQTTVSCSAWLKIRLLPKCVDEINESLKSQVHNPKKPKGKIKEVLETNAKN